MNAVLAQPKMTPKLRAFYERHGVIQGDSDDDCVLWPRGTCRRSGRTYGRVWLPEEKRVATAHVVAWELAKGRKVRRGYVLWRDRIACEHALCICPAHWHETHKCHVARRALEAGSAYGPSRAAAARAARVRPRTKLTLEQAREIRARPETSIALAAELGVSPSLIRMIRRGEIWRDTNPWSGLR